MDQEKQKLHMGLLILKSWLRTCIDRKGKIPKDCEKNAIKQIK